MQALACASILYQQWQKKDICEQVVTHHLQSIINCLQAAGSRVCTLDVRIELQDGALSCLAALAMAQPKKLSASYTGLVRGLQV
jgi:hypothetical protein